MRARPHKQVLERYFRAWESHNRSEVARLFAVDAKYEIIGSRILHGLNEILSYWDNNSHTQRHISWQIDDSAGSASDMMARWTAVFFRTDRGEWFHLVGLMWFTVRKSKIVRLCECYRRRRSRYRPEITSNG